MSAAGGWRGLGLAMAVVSVSACHGAIGSAGRGATVGAAGAAGTATSSPGAGGGGGTQTAATGAAGTDPTGGGPRPALACSGASNQPGYRMMRRLSQNEYNRTMRDVFGLDETAFPDIAFTGELARKGAYETLSDGLTVDQPFMAAFVDKTFDRAQQLLAGATAATILAAPCVAATPDAACATAVVRKYGYRMFRRPVTDDEVTTYVALFTQGMTDAKLAAKDALAGMLAALMQSPKTLYIGQLGALAGNAYKLDPYEVASVMAYGLTGSAPSQALLDRVGTGALGTPAGIAKEAGALIDSAAGKAHLQRFFHAWLQYDKVSFVAKDPAVYALPASLSTAMVTESQMLVDAVQARGGGVVDLLLAPQTYVNLELAKHYNWDTTGLTNATFVERQRPAGQGLGFLAQGAQLTRLGTSNSSSPTQRGVFALHQLMCRELGQPPPVVPDIVPPSGTITTRQRYEDVHGVAACSPCHVRIDRVGFGFENFDGVGVYRTMEVGKPIDASGSITDLGNVMFNGPEDLARKLAAAPEISQCLAAQMTSYVYGVSVADALCLAPDSAYSATPKLGFKDVLTQIAAASELTTRAQ